MTFRYEHIEVICLHEIPACFFVEGLEEGKSMIHASSKNSPKAIPVLAVAFRGICERFLDGTVCKVSEAGLG